MPTDSTRQRGAVQDLAASYLAQVEREAKRRAADASPTGRVATVNALADATASFVRTQPAKAVAAHSAADSGAYSIVGGTRDVVAVPDTRVRRRVELRATYTPDAVVIDPSSKTFAHIIGAPTPVDDDEPTHRIEVRK